ncbi:hypothetical protein Q1W73_01885 [Asticcacaulis sp. ZE23SCel15]|uniref:hypothetical protein n=1 Tax=Asticcacaulis sp. ZE23SCel15 TaxID=3059027 RepID=UPI0026602EC3|nr:hypothetical protein [Asticcacaulis sp. ZE23SCel15]WKL57757.1 hypothetical protein Q1W73_01885 [Asticcacaulis sp. ZE23SCel15]
MGAKSRAFTAIFCTLIATPVHAADAPDVSINLHQIAEAPLKLEVTITNNDDVDICYELSHGVRAFTLKRGNRTIEGNFDHVPFVSLKDRCDIITSKASHSEPYDLSRIFPNMRPKDNICFVARVKFYQSNESTYTEKEKCLTVR